MKCSSIIDANLVQEGRMLLLNANRIVIFPHKSPDGDSIGSSLSLYHLLTNMGKHVSVVCPDAPSKTLNFLPGIENLVIYRSHAGLARRIINNSDLVCYMDFNSISRIGDLAQELANYKGKSIMIDHHPYPEAKCDVLLSDSTQSSTSEYLYYFLSEAGWEEKITPEIATCIYAGIMSDTGFLSYNSSKSETYTTIANLLSKGIDKEYVHECLQNDYTEHRMQLVIYALSNNLMILEEYNTAYIYLSQEELERYNYESGDLEGVVNIPLKMSNIKFSVLFTGSDSMIKISFRSKKEFPANQVAKEHFEGGGHRNAAGGKSMQTLEETVNRFLSILPNYKDALL